MYILLLIVHYKNINTYIYLVLTCKMMLICIFFFKKEPHVIMYDNDSTFCLKLLILWSSLVFIGDVNVDIHVTFFSLFYFQIF